MNIFANLPAGDSAAWSDAPVVLPDGRLADAAAWQLTYHLRGATALDLVAAPDGKTWRTTLSATASATLQAGAYAWAAVITAGAERITVGSGQATIAPDLADQVAGYDGRSVAEVALANCEAAMATFNATGGKVKKYEIAGRTMEFQTIADLRSLHDFWAAKVRTQKAKQSIANGMGNPRNLHVRFVAP